MSRLIGSFALTMAVLGLAGGFHLAAAQSPPVQSWHYVWTAPAEGSPVAFYRAEVVVDGADTTRIDRIGATELSIPVEFGHDYEVRVAAVDTRDIQGDFSIWSRRETCELPMH